MNKEPLRNKIHTASTNNSLVVDKSFFVARDVKSAVEWLKEEVRKRRLFLIHPSRVTMLDNIIDEAFTDLEA